MTLAHNRVCVSQWTDGLVPLKHNYCHHTTSISPPTIETTAATVAAGHHDDPNRSGAVSHPARPVGSLRLERPPRLLSALWVNGCSWLLTPQPCPARHHLSQLHHQPRALSSARSPRSQVGSASAQLPSPRARARRRRRHLRPVLTATRPPRLIGHGPPRRRAPVPRPKMPSGQRYAASRGTRTTFTSAGRTAPSSGGCTMGPLARAR